ncbi:hypothetical protein HK100_004050, partial [Physocladia obscura]
MLNLLQKLRQTISEALWYCYIRLQVMREPIPPWFDATLVPFFLKRRLIGLQWKLYKEKLAIAASFDKLGLQIENRLTWSRARMILNAAVPQSVPETEIDLIIGLKSGGAFLSHILKTDRFPRADILYMKVSRNSGPAANFGLAQVLDKKLSELASQHLWSLSISEVPDSELVRGKRVLIVDDFVGTGSTILGAVDVVKGLGAADIKIVVLAGTRFERDDVVTWKVDTGYSKRFLVTPW